MQALITLIDIPAQKAVMGSSFTPTLGQYGVGIREFCNIFNNKTKDFREDLPFNLSISVQSREKFNISKLKINPNFIVKVMSYNLKSISLKDIFISFSIMSRFGADLPMRKLKSSFKTYIAYIKSFKIRIVD